jgi:hypothetical protein
VINAFFCSSSRSFKKFEVAHLRIDKYERRSFSNDIDITYKRGKEMANVTRLCTWRRWYARENINWRIRASLRNFAVSR